jgi:HSP20 family protein
MTLVKRERHELTPWTAFRELEDRLNRLFGSWPIEAEALTGTWYPAVDIRETKDAFILEADLPGLKKEDIEVTVVDDVVTIKGERKEEEERKSDGYHRYERVYGAFQRSFRIPGGIEAKGVEAKFENGVLTVTLPKPEEAKPKQIEVQVK